MKATKEQIIAEANRRRAEHGEGAPPVEHFIVDVVCDGWTPPEPEPEPVDPDVLAFREWAAERWPVSRSGIEKGGADYRIEAKAYLAGARMAREQEAAASAERIKELEARVAELEAEFEGGPVCQPIVSKSDEPQTSDRAALEALILVVERDGHDGSHLEDDDGQNECPVCATVATIRAMREAL